MSKFIPEPGDIVILPGGSLGCITEVREATSKPFEGENVFWNVDVVRSYWKEHKRKDIGNVTYLVNVVHLPSDEPKGFIYPDTTIKILKNPVTRKLSKDFLIEDYKSIKEEEKVLKKESLRSCATCNKPIRFYQPRKQERCWDMSGKYFVARHSGC